MMLFHKTPPFFNSSTTPFFNYPMLHCFNASIMPAAQHLLHIFQRNLLIGKKH